jgi:hypothetical protein
VPAETKGFMLYLLKQFPTILGCALGQWFAEKAITLAQKKIEKSHLVIRNKMLDQDKQIEEGMAFSGYSE